MSLEKRLNEGEVQRQAEIDDLRSALVRTQRELLRAKGKTEFLVEAVIEAARDAVLAHPLQIPKSKVKPSKGRSEAAVWHLTDWQGAKKTVSYNTDVMRERVRLFVDKAARITDIQRKDHPVDHCHIQIGRAHV